MANVLVTGGAGYIGSTLVPALLGAGHRVTVVDRFYFGRDSLADAAAHYGDALSLQALDVRALEPRLFDGIDAVVDLAGISNDPACELDPALSLDINHAGAMRVAHLAHIAGVERLVFASSCSVYGSGASERLTEDSPLCPVSLYAECKARVERELLELAGESDLCVTTLRLATVFGLSKRMRFDLAVNLMTKNAYLDGLIRVTGGGRQWRPFVHVRDVARAMMRVLESPPDKVRSRCFNVGSDELNFQMRTLAYRVRDHVADSRIEFAASDPDNRSYNVSFDRIREELDFKVHHGVEAGIDEIRAALAAGELDPDDRRWYTLKQYLFLDEVERTHEQVAQSGRILRTRNPEGDRTASTPRPAEATASDPRPAIEFFRHSLGENELDSLRQTFGSPFLTLGPRVEEFERRFAEFEGAPHAVGVSSCSMGLVLVLRAHGIGPGDEVITTPMTFAATSNAILQVGATVVFADVAPDTGLLDPDAVEAAVTPRTRAIVAVHLYGQLCDVPRFRAIADRHGLALIEDSAHAVESRRGAIRPGTLGDAATFSFYATKTLTCGDGGAVVTRDGALASKVRLLRNHGIAKDAASRYGQAYQHWDMETLGYKSALTDIQASILLPQLAHLEARRARREALVARYEDRLANVPEFERIRRTGVSAHHLFTVLAPDGTRDAILASLGRRGVGCAVNYRAVHTLQYYREVLGFAPDSLPIARRMGERTLSLPLWPDLPPSDVDVVVRALREALAEARG